MNRLNRIIHHFSPDRNDREECVASGTWKSHPTNTRTSNQPVDINETHHGNGHGNNDDTTESHQHVCNNRCAASSSSSHSPSEDTHTNSPSTSSSFREHPHPSYNLEPHTPLHLHGNVQQLSCNPVASGRTHGIGMDLVNGITSSPLRWDGWGYKDTAFYLHHNNNNNTINNGNNNHESFNTNPNITQAHSNLSTSTCSDPSINTTSPTATYDMNNSTGHVQLLGHRYLFSGKILPSLRPWMEEKVGIDVNDYKPGRLTEDLNTIPPPILNQPFIDAVCGHRSSNVSEDGNAHMGSTSKASASPASSSPVIGSYQSYKHCKHFDYESAENRLFHSHGHTCQEIYMLRYTQFERVVDAVIYPRHSDDIQQIVKYANQYNVCLIPYGGGTSVSQALIVPATERRMVCSVDMHLLNHITISRYNMTAVLGAGCVGKDLESYLNARGLTMGHEPDSMEFSTLGGWIATRASGMRKNKYGNIEDIIVNVTMVTSTGVVKRLSTSPRVSHGLNLNEVILGSEGILGIITEATVKLRPLPQHTQYGSIIFPTFELGCKFLYTVQQHHYAPVSIRLVDNMQFQFGMALKPPAEDWLHDIKSKIQKWYVTQRLQFQPDQMVACTLLFEGTRSQISQQEKNLYTLAKKYHGVKAGEENGIRGYFLTYMIAYLRDFGFNYNFIAESFETSVPWDKVGIVCSEVKQRIIDTAMELGIKKAPFVSCRVTQLYDAGVCVYFYFGFICSGLKGNDPLHVFNQIEHAARDEIMLHGGSLSHHHGIGKLRKYATHIVQGEMGVELMKSMKEKMDPKNIFGSGNLIDV